VDMCGGVSVAGDETLRFIPKPGRKKKTTAAAAADDPATSSESADDDEFSEYSDGECPDGFIDSENEEDEIIHPRRTARQLGARSGGDPPEALSTTL
jgi:hypothetical protein